MISHDYYKDRNSDPRLRSLNNMEECYDDNVTNDDATMPIYSTIGRGPQGMGVYPRIVKESDDAFIFELVDDTETSVMTSNNLHAGHLSFSEDNPDDPKKIIVSIRKDGSVEQYGVKMPIPNGTFIFTTTDDFTPLKYNPENIYYNIPTDKIFNLSGRNPKEGDMLLFKVVKSEAVTSLYFLSFGTIINASSTAVTVYVGAYSPLYDVSEFIDAIKDYVDAQIAIEKAERESADTALGVRIDKIEARTDVVDVVSVYDRQATTASDIVHYDVSKITVDDIVKVLKNNDPSHPEVEGQTSYYRYTGMVSTTPNWVYVGSSGPFVLSSSATSNLVYSRSGGHDTTLAYTNLATANTLAFRDSNARLKVNGAIAPDDATNKQDIEDAIVDLKTYIDTEDLKRALKSGDTFTGTMFFVQTPKNMTGGYYLNTQTLTSGVGITLEPTTEGLKIVNADHGKTVVHTGDVIFSSTLTTEAEVIAAKGGLSWELLSSDGGVYEWHCLDSGSSTSTITIDVPNPVVAYDDPSSTDITVTATCSDPSATLTWDIVGGDSCVTIS